VDRPQAGGYTSIALSDVAAGQRRRVGLRMRRDEHMGPAKIYFIIFGVLTIAGGVVGYV